MGETERFALDDGWELLLTGALIDDGGFSGGHTSSTLGLLHIDGDEGHATVHDVIDAIDARAAAEHPVWLELRRGDVAVVLADERSDPLDGSVELFWPPIVSEAGVLLRHSRTSRTSDGRPRWDTEMQHPWLVAPDGTVTQLPFELGVSPLGVLPDGRYLLPGSDPLWRDDYDESLSALSHDGETEPLLVGGEPLRPSRLVRLADPAWAPERERDASGWPVEDFPFDTQRARIDGDELIVLLADYALKDWAEDSPYMDEPALRWVTAAASLDGSAMRLIAHGTTAPGEAPQIPW